MKFQSNPPDHGDYKMPFGKFKGRRLTDIAGTYEGLRYLDWICGLENPPDAVVKFCQQPSIAAEIDAAIDDYESGFERDE